MMRFIFFIILYHFNFLFTHGQSLSWAKNFGRGDVALSTQLPNALARDVSGNIYTTGSFTSGAGGIDFDPGGGVFNLISGGGTDVFISKLDSNGNFIWALKLGGSGTQKAFHIALDTTGNIYVAGTFRGNPDFDPGAGVFTITSSGNDDVFIMKLDPSGNFLWAKSIGGNQGLDDNIINSLIVDDVGNIYFTGAINGGGQSFDLDPNSGTFLLTLPGTAFFNIYSAKWDMNGNFVWAKQLIENIGLNNEGNAIELDASGNCFIVGSFNNVIDFDPGAGVFNMGVMGVTHTFLWVLSSAGNFIAAREFGGSNVNESSIGMSFNFDSGNNIYITGTFSGTSDFDPGGSTFNLSSPSISTQSLFVVKLNPIGNLLWAKAISVTPGFVNNISSGIGSVGSCGITVIGSFFGTADFDPNGGVFNLTASGLSSYILQLDPNGNFVYAFVPDITFKSPLDIDIHGNMYGTGTFSGTVDFDASTNTFNLTAPAAGNSTFVIKMFPSPWLPETISPVSACLNSNDTLFASTTLGSSLSWYSTAVGGTFLANGNNYITPLLSDTSIFYVQDSTCREGLRDSIIVNTELCILLPITLLAFDAYNINNKEVLMEWSTTTELNNDFFTVERSIDAIHFEAVETIKGAGNSSELLNYTYVDKPLNIATTSVILYYRLKQTDYDGNYRYFDVQAVNFDKRESLDELDIYPNPTKGEVFINLQNSDFQTLKINLMDAVGRKKEIKNINTGSQQIISLPEELPRGIYFLEIQMDNQRVLKKIIKN